MTNKILEKNAFRIQIQYISHLEAEAAVSSSQLEGTLLGAAQRALDLYKAILANEAVRGGCQKSLDVIHIIFIILMRSTIKHLQYTLSNSIFYFAQLCIATPLFSFSKDPTTI